MSDKKMREVLFRGKLKYGEGWIYGNYIKIGSLDSICEGTKLFKAIIPETRGEFTGLTDKSGTKIFEGDIVKLDSMRYAVEWRTDGWIFRCIEPKTWSSPYFGSHAQSAKVIGNIHDNPELIGGAEDE